MIQLQSNVYPNCAMYTDLFYTSLRVHHVGANIPPTLASSTSRRTKPVPRLTPSLPLIHQECLSQNTEVSRYTLLTLTDIFLTSNPHFFAEP